MVNVKATAPTRIDLAGGTLDLWPLYSLLDHKATVNIGIDLSASVSVEESQDGNFRLVSEDLNKTEVGDFNKVCQSQELPLPGLLLSAIWDDELPPVCISTSAKSPAGAGLGGSSCLGITIAGALLKARRQANPSKSYPELSDHDLVRLVQDVEARLIKAPTGCQDYWGAVRGGINLIRFPFGNTEVETLPGSHLKEMSDELVVCFSGKSRASAINNWEIFKRIFDGDQELLDVFGNIGRKAEECALAAAAGDWQQVLNHSEEEWNLRTRLWPNIETPETKALDQAAREAGILQ